MSSKRVCVTGAGGFIGSHLAKRLKEMGYYVVACDWRRNEYMRESKFCDEFKLMDLRVYANCAQAVAGCSHVYHLAADMGGMGFIHANHAMIMYNNTTMSCNMLEASRDAGVTHFFFASSACVYPEYKQLDTNLDAGLAEGEAWPAQPQDAYGLEKLYTEDMCMHYGRDYNMHVRIARFHNIYGPYGTWKGGREKAPAAFCRKIAACGDAIEVWGDGEQTRSFMYVDDCVDGIIRLMESSIAVPVNLGSNRMVSVNQLVAIIQNIAQSSTPIKHLTGPMGVRGRNSNNEFVKQHLQWEPRVSLEEGLMRTYTWIAGEMEKEKHDGVDVTHYSASQTCIPPVNVRLGELPGLF